MKITIYTRVKNPCVEKRVEVEITAEDIKALAEQKLYEQYSDEALIEIYDCRIDGYMSF